MVRWGAGGCEDKGMWGHEGVGTGGRGDISTGTRGAERSPGRI